MWVPNIKTLPSHDRCSLQSCLFDAYSIDPVEENDSVMDEELADDESDVGQLIDENKIRLRARVGYDGTWFQGWQFQNKGRSVQAEVEAVLMKRFRRHIRIIGAGRTDAGVHARGQAFHFDLYQSEVIKGPVEVSEDNIAPITISMIFLNQLQKAMNRMLPHDVRVWNLSQAPSFISVIRSSESDDSITQFRHYSWHAIANASAKLYSYRLSFQPGAIALDPLQRFSRVHIPEPVDVEYLQRVLKHFEGTHDFRAFAGAIESYQRKKGSTAMEKNTVRTIYNITLIDESIGYDYNAGNYRIDIVLQGALFKMVRNIVGTAIDVAKGKLKESILLQWISQNSTASPLMYTRKDNKCKPAPPEGLTLEHVFYDDNEF
jgi:tRNA pseudouridine38-40 synthase